MARGILLAPGLFESIGFKTDAASLVEYLLDLTGAPGCFQIMDHPYVLISKETLRSLGLCGPCHVHPPVVRIIAFSG
jgi:hypothetical protein